MVFDLDVAIAGGGITGLAIARSLIVREPKLRIALLEKESKVGLHASGRNSGVLHAGFYYSAESLKARFCADGNSKLRAFAANHGIPVLPLGKVVVARNADELGRLETLYDRGLQNGIELELLEASRLAEFEPLARTTGAFLWSPTTAVSLPGLMVEAMRAEVIAMGVEVRPDAAVARRSGETFVHGDAIRARHFVNASGAGADRLAHGDNVATDFAMLPFLGVYRQVHARQLPLQRLVYPVPDPINPFLGVHFTVTADGRVKVGPTAMPVLGREQYRAISRVPLRDIVDSAQGLLALARGDRRGLVRMIAEEAPRVLGGRLLEEARDLVPAVSAVPGWRRAPAGIRAQLVHLPTGALAQDFIVATGPKSTHILNAVSPGWTSSLAFAEWIADAWVLPALA